MANADLNPTHFQHAATNHCVVLGGKITHFLKVISQPGSITYRAWMMFIQVLRLFMSASDHRANKCIAITASLHPLLATHECLHCMAISVAPWT